MAKEIAKKTRPWTRPELVRLGKLVDVAPGQAGSTEGASGKS